MNKKILSIVLLVLTLLLIVIVLFHVCSALLLEKLYNDIGNRDWRIMLSNGYEIQKLNGNEILLIKDGWDKNTDIVISSSISAYCQGNRYLGVTCNNINSSVQTNSDDAFFYLIDMQNDVLFGPYTRTEYEQQCIGRNWEGLNQWISTEPRPSDALFK